MSRNWLLIVQSDFWQFFRMRYRKIKSKIELLKSISNMYIEHLPIWIIILQRISFLISWIKRFFSFLGVKPSKIFLNVDIWKKLTNCLWNCHKTFALWSNAGNTHLSKKMCNKILFNQCSFSSVFITYFDELFVHICRKLEYLLKIN